MFQFYEKFHPNNLITITLFIIFVYGCSNSSNDSVSDLKIEILNFSYNNIDDVYVGDSLELAWSSKNANYCEADGDWQGIKLSSSSERIILDTEKLYSFFLTCVGDGNSTARDEITFESNFKKVNLIGDAVIFKNKLLIENQEIFSLVDRILVDIFKFNDRYYILSYNANENIASGQKLETSYVGIELHIFENNFPIYVGNYFADSSFESIFKKIFMEDAFLICSNQECYIFDNSNETLHMKVNEFIDGYEILGIKKNSYFEIDLIKSQQKYFLFDSDQNKYDLKKLILDSNLVFLEINAIESPSDLLTISEINNNNLLYSIQDNSEGRVVWGQKYLLDGIIFGIENGNSILDLNFNYYLKNENLDFLFSKRYSFSRESQLFLLHVARYYNMLIQYKVVKPGIVNNPNFQKQLSDLEKILLFTSDAYETVEDIVLFNFDEIGIRDYLIFRPESDFWANGINVPINYVSDYIISLININTDESLNLAKKLVETNFILMDELNYPSWRYWSGMGLSGWEDTSVNTPSFIGEQDNPYSADIIYRSTDAHAVLLSCRNLFLREQLTFDCQDAENKILSYLKNGDLEPYLFLYYPTIELTTPEINEIKEKFSRLVLISDIKNLYFFDTHLTSIQ